jgi:hypothetical protein
MTTQMNVHGGGHGHKPGCTCPYCAASRGTAEAPHIDLVATLDDEAQAADQMAFMERTMGTPPEPETGYCAECGHMWIEDPHGSPGVKVHYDPESPNTIDHEQDEDHTPVPENDEMENRPYSSDAFPNGKCGACGFGLDEHGSCYQHDCSAFHAGSPLADLGSMTSGENLEEVHASDLVGRDRIMLDGVEKTVVGFAHTEQGSTPVLVLDDGPRTDIDPDMVVFRFERECDRHGGEWGSDETCERCTTEDGEIRPFDQPGSLGKCWSCAEDGYDTEADTGDDNGPLCEGCAERRAEDEADAVTDLDETEDEIVHEFQALGSSSSFAVTYSETDDDYSFYRDGTFVGSFDYDGWSTDHAAIEQAALRVFPVEAPAATCTDETGHLSGSDHRWQDCPTYADTDD